MNSSRLASYLVTFSCSCKSISVGREIRKSFSTFTCCIVLIVLETKYLVSNTINTMQHVNVENDFLISLPTLMDLQEQEKVTK